MNKFRKRGFIDYDARADYTFERCQGSTVMPVSNSARPRAPALNGTLPVLRNTNKLRERLPMPWMRAGAGPDEYTWHTPRKRLALMISQT